MLRPTHLWQTEHFFLIYDGYKRFAQMLMFLFSACNGVSILNSILVWKGDIDEVKG